MKRSKYFNGVSEDAPTFFQCKNEEIIKSKPQNRGIFRNALKKFGISNENPLAFHIPNTLVKPSSPLPIRSYSTEPFLPHQPSNLQKNQDFDSVKFSIKQDLTLGIKDKVRSNSVFHQTFINRIRNNKGFYKQKRELTGNLGSIRIERSGKTELQNLENSKMIKSHVSKMSLRRSSYRSTKLSSIDPDSSLMRDFELEISLAKTPASTRYGRLN